METSEKARAVSAPRPLLSAVVTPGSGPAPLWSWLLELVDWPHTGAALRLAPRELEVAKRLCLGRSLLHVAHELEISLGTVKTYTRRTYRKLGVDCRCELVLSVLAVNLTAADFSSAARDVS